MSVVGRSVPRADAGTKVRGEATYGVDFEVAGTLYGALTLSGVPSGRIRAVDTGPAEAMPGVRGVFTASDAPDICSGLAVNDQPLFASDVVRFEGEAIAAVVAETMAQARAAAAAVRVEIEETEAIATVEEALAEGAPLIHEDWHTYSVRDGLPDFPRAGNVCGEMTVDQPGVDEGLAAADVVIEDVFHIDRQYQAYLEPKNATGVFEDGRYTIHVAHQQPWNVRDRSAAALGVRPSDVRIVGHHIGGGFGAKLDTALEPYAALLARLVGAPVKMVHDRSDDILTCASREGAVIRMRSGVTRDGRIVAREFLCDMDAGAYAGDTPFLTSIPIFVVGSLYRVGPTRIVSRAVYTNTAPTGAFRGVSGTYLYFALERHTDNLANAIGMDRREFRVQNLMSDGHVMLNGQALDDAGILTTAFDKAEQHAPWRDLGKGPNRGVGMAAAVWLTNPMAGEVSLQLHTDGRLGVVTGATENGSGAVAMGVRQVAAEELGITADEVVLTMPDTDMQGFDAGSQGSRTTHIVGRAVHNAAVGMRERIRTVAGQVLGQAPDDLEVAGGGVRIKGEEDVRMTLSEVARAALGAGGPIASTGSYATPAPKFDPEAAAGLLFPIWPTPTYHVHVAEVEVDPVTGEVTVLRYIVVQEVGKAINPAGVMGQIVGGVAQGLGYALYEGLQIGPDARYRQRTLEAYRLPVALDMPEIEVVLLEHPASEGPFGAKGVAEPPVVPVAAAIGNAIADATGGSIDRVPITPEDVLDALDQGSEERT
jgi:CO/xanthine dehydrogenase Mo-binding subunit